MNDLILAVSKFVVVLVIVFVGYPKLVDYLRHDIKSDFYRTVKKKKNDDDTPILIEMWVVIPFKYFFIMNKHNRKDLLFEDLLIFINKLTANQKYKTETHNSFIKGFKTLHEEGIIEITGEKFLDERCMFLRKLPVFNLSRMFIRKKFYQIDFIKK